MRNRYEEKKKGNTNEKEKMEFSCEFLPYITQSPKNEHYLKPKK
ncbi:hypothetical protein [Priestia endophytica]|nr:hypothetical protein [Priestia endophytica]RPK13043.1 hypothetical protein FH5_03249 [Priestia endophytica]